MARLDRHLAARNAAGADAGAHPRRPFTIADATTLTEAGYVGEDIETSWCGCCRPAASTSPVRNAASSIDEIDKIARKSENRSITRDVSGEGVQQSAEDPRGDRGRSVPPQGGRWHPQRIHPDQHQGHPVHLLAVPSTRLDKVMEPDSDGNGSASPRKRERRRSAGRSCHSRLCRSGTRRPAALQDH
ncbi:MAG: AAA family ATPase, partial [Gemmatimonadetes bacterium]|nr:AAA family ATPase [Gemmatimonadota bacterium]